MKIARVALYHVSIPCPAPFYPTWIPGYPQTHNTFDLIRLTTDEGIEGWSAGAAMGREREGLGDLIGAYLIGLDPTNIDLVHQRLKEASYLGWRNYWIEPAFWDIIGKAKGQPVYELLGGKARRLPVYCSTGELHSPEQRAEEALQIKAKGFKGIKLRVKSPHFQDDVAQLRAVREALGSDYLIAVDANQGWRVTIVDDIPAWTWERAAEFAKACEDYQIAWLEEPLDARDYDGLAHLRTKARTKIAGGELNYGWDELKIMLEKQSLDIYQPDATFAGGIATARRVMQACRERGLGFSPHTWTNGIGFYINQQVMLADPENDLLLEYPYEPPGWVPEVRDGILTEPIKVDYDGTVDPPTAPGLGFSIDMEKLKRYGKKFYETSQAGLAINLIRSKGLRQALPLMMKKRQEGKGQKV